MRVSILFPEQSVWMTVSERWILKKWKCIVYMRKTPWWRIRLTTVDSEAVMGQRLIAMCVSSHLFLHDSIPQDCLALFHRKRTVRCPTYTLSTKLYV